MRKKIATKESDNPLKYFADEDASTIPNFEFQTITSDHIEIEIKRLKVNKSAGYDKISVQFVKDAEEILCKPLSAIFNSSFKNGIFPDKWKIATVTSIFKSGSKSEMGNYMPISVLSVFSRLLERFRHDLKLFTAVSPRDRAWGHSSLSCMSMISSSASKNAPQTCMRTTTVSPVLPKISTISVMI